MKAVIPQSALTDMSPRIEILHVLPERSRGAEIGVADGHHALQIWNVVRPSYLLLVDLWSHEAQRKAVAELFKGHPEVEMKVCPSQIASENVEEGDLDWVYIDANHTYKEVYQDTLWWYEKVCPGGFLVWHDQAIPDVARAIKDVTEKAGLQLQYVCVGRDRMKTLVMKKVPPARVVKCLG